MGDIEVRIPTDDDMRRFGACLAGMAHGGDVIMLSGPLGAGKTTLAQGFGAGLHVAGLMVSPTFTIARELEGRFADGSPARLIHVDAYRLGGGAYAPGQDDVNRLLDELESLGLDEELESPGDGTVVLMEWGEQMATALADERLEVHIDRSCMEASDVDAVLAHRHTAEVSGMPDGGIPDDGLSERGVRHVRLHAVGSSWSSRDWSRIVGGQGVF